MWAEIADRRRTGIPPSRKDYLLRLYEKEHEKTLAIIEDNYTEYDSDIKDDNYMNQVIVFLGVPCPRRVAVVAAMQLNMGDDIRDHAINIRKHFLTEEYFEDVNDVVDQIHQYMAEVDSLYAPARNPFRDV